MRFLKRGPAIPDELLIARDEGRVVFFCGAGVSRARAGLPDFFGLAKSVAESLGVGSGSPVRTILEEAPQIAARVGVGGLISADRIFGLLEREFDVKDIHAAVARSLRPSSGVDLSAHRVMLDLARGPDHRVRLVTTNFDRLFEASYHNLRCWQPPRLPDPVRYDDLDGIVHLHGRVSEDYGGSEGEGFVLSSAEFGRAYLSEAWATAFIQSVLQKYLVVFVGYTADDPPVQYLLEALNRRMATAATIYAFQAGDPAEAQAKWHQKGVEAIAYVESEDHAVLWDTLSAWSTRASDRERWYESVVAIAAKGPEDLASHERGQIAHVASTVEGVRRFIDANNPLISAKWLCVFDPLVRYSRPSHDYSDGNTGSFIDPFELFGLDDDVVPQRIGPDDPYPKRDVPKVAWDCFALTRLDRHDLRDNNLPALRGHLSTNVSQLPPRLFHLGFWIQKICHEPAAVWWAAGQNGIHPDLQSRIRFEIDKSDSKATPEVRKAWRLLFEAWAARNSEANLDWFSVKASITLDGWTSATVRALGNIHKPYFEAKRPYGSPRPPDWADCVVRDLVSLDVKYPRLHERIEIPKAYLALAVREFRTILENAITLENELGGYGLTDLVPIEPDPNLPGTSTGRSFGLAVPFLFYVDLFKRLAASDPFTARQEVASWRIDDDIIFARLRIWSCGVESVLSLDEAGKLIAELGEQPFWDQRHQRDLLIVLARRWQGLPVPERTAIERRLLQGPSRWQDEEVGHHMERRAWRSLNRLHWLAENGCQFSFDLTKETSRLRSAAPKWEPSFGKGAAASLEGSSDWVKTEKTFASLLSLPLAEVLSKASELGEQRELRFVKNDPFAGLAAAKPVRAFRALVLAAQNGLYPEWAWRTFLNSEARRSDKPRLIKQVAERLTRIPTDALVPLMHIVSEWLVNASEILLSHYPGTFDRLWSVLTKALAGETDSVGSSVSRGSREPDWATEALNAPVGKLAQVLMNDPSKNELRLKSGLPRAWLQRVELLLGMPGDGRRYALAMFSFNMHWFYAIDPDWTEPHLIVPLETDEDDQAAVWAGFFWRNMAPAPDLYRRLKPHLLDAVKTKSVTRRGHVSALAGILLLGWGDTDNSTGQRIVSSAEERDALVNGDEEFRLHTLWQLERWCQGEERWRSQVLNFLREVWPRNKKAKSSKVSSRLCELAFVNPEIFPDIVYAVVPLIEKAEGEHLLLHELTKPDSVVDKYPKDTLALLYAILPTDISLWPYRIEEVLQKLELAASDLLTDPKLIEIKRQWASR